MMSRLRALVIRLASGPGLRPADGVVLASLIFSVLFLVYSALHYYGLTNPRVVPYIDQEWVEMSLALTMGVALPGSIAFLVAGLLARRRWPEGRLLAHGLVQCASVALAYASYSNGHYTDLLGATALFGLTVLGLLLFDARIVRGGMLTFIVLVAATTTAEQMGLVRYAPIFTEAPFSRGHLATSWLLGRGGVSFVILVVVAYLFVGAMERLGRATALIRRYVPAQLAERILSGEHTGTARPERRKVTLFFSDVVGFTDTADEMEPEDLSALLNEYLSEMTAIADRFGATVNQFVGDGIMIFFGAPEATNDRDHALRAVRMALAMQGRMRELGEKWFNEGIQTPFRIRVGVNTGVASVGDFGSEGRTTYSAIGNQTNLTARIQDHCEPGKVLISHTTWALVKDEIACEEHGEIEVKGLHYPVRVYEVVEEASSDAGDV